ncbi:hypothetical protein CRYUN_Cryun08bG0097800 [Craigia yunnanensis]
MMKTGCVALVLCLNISVNPPDVIKISPCARMECWIDPFSMAPQKALETIGKNLRDQYERWQPKARCKVELDPTVDEVKKLCNTCRRYAKSERALFHYKGHGVPKPAANGEIWLFNKFYDNACSTMKKDVHGVPPRIFPRSSIVSLADFMIKEALPTVKGDIPTHLCSRKVKDLWSLVQLSCTNEALKAISGPPGDLYVYLDVAEVKGIQRDGINLSSTASISYIDAILGSVVTCTFVRDETLHLKYFL